MARRQFLITNLALLIMIVFIFAWAIFEKNELSFTLFGINFIIIGLINLLFSVKYYKETKRRLAGVYFIIALSFWLLSLVYFNY